MYSDYRNSSIASFSSAGSGSNYDPSMSNPSLSLTSPELPSITQLTSADFWNPSPSPSLPTPLGPPQIEQPQLPLSSINGIVHVYQFTPQQGEPKARITVHIGFKQLPGRVIGLRIVLGGIGLRTQVAHGHKKGHWQLRAEVPEMPGSMSPSVQALKIEALEGDGVIDSVEFGAFTLWDAGTMPASALSHNMLASRRVRSFDNHEFPQSHRSSASYNRSSSIASTLAAAASAPSLTTASASSPSSAPIAVRALNGNPDAYRIVRRTEIPMEREAAALAVTMNIHGDVRTMSSGWTQEEISSRRRLVQFWRHMEGPVVNVHFCAITPDEYDDSRIVVSCIYREDSDKCYITSFDLIRLLEGIIGTVCNIDEKNRIRRNVHHIEHDTISKSKPYHEEFFDLIMSFPAPMPRRNVRDLKAFRWEYLPDALHAIMDKMALDYNPKAVSEMIEPSIPELAEPGDASMPTFAPHLHSEPSRRDSSFSLDGGFGFRKPSMASSTLSFDTISPNSSVASFHHHAGSPSASLTNFHISGHSPNASVQSFAQNNLSHHSFHSPSASVTSFSNHLAPMNYNTQQGGSSPHHSVTAFGGGSRDTSMDLSGMDYTASAGAYANPSNGTSYYQQQQQQQQSSLEGALGLGSGYYMG